MEKYFYRLNCNTICVIVDKLIKRAHFILIDIQFSSGNMVQLLNDKDYSLYKLLLQIVSNKEIQHLAEIFWKKYKLLGIESTMSTVYHLQTDGQIEYIDQILEQYPKYYVDYNLKTGQTYY